MSIFHLKPLRQQTDEQLMARAAAGSDTAFEELYRRYARRLKGFFFMQLGGDEELAADATHDVFLRAYEAQLLASLDAEPVSNQQIEVDLDAAILDEALAQVLNELPAPLHQIFSLHYQEELTIPQIAEIVGVPEGTVKSRLHKTMNIIRKKLKQYENK